jgi:hypothetical protein
MIGPGFSIQMHIAQTSMTGNTSGSAAIHSETSMMRLAIM